MLNLYRNISRELLTSILLSAFLALLGVSSLMLGSAIIIWPGTLNYITKKMPDFIAGAVDSFINTVPNPLIGVGIVGFGCWVGEVADQILIRNIKSIIENRRPTLCVDFHDNKPIRYYTAPNIATGDAPCIFSQDPDRIDQEMRQTQQGTLSAGELHRRNINSQGLAH